MTELDWTGLAALVVAIGGAVGAILGGMRLLRGDKFHRSVEESTALLSGYRDMVASLRVELENARKELAAERAAWNVDRRELYGEIDKLRESMALERSAWHAERQDLHRQINELRDEVATLQPRAMTDRTRKGDGPRRAPSRD